MNLNTYSNYKSDHTILFIIPAVTGVNCVVFKGPVICYKLTLLYVSIIFACFLFLFTGVLFCWIFILILTVWDFVAGTAD